jgi:SLT domain-containing protein
MSHIPGLNSGFGKMITAIPRRVLDGVIKFISGKDKAAMAANVPNVGSGVARWSSVVLQALALNHAPASLLKQVLYQIGTESGGNPNAQNNTDINAAHGIPSKGLLQVIPPTFAANHVAGTSWNIFDPLANVAAAIHYAQRAYGPSLMRGSMGLGSGHGYAMGTNNAAPGWALLGENGPEWAHFNGGEKVRRSGDAPRGGKTIIIENLNVEVKGHALASKAEIGRTVKQAIAYAERHGD